MAKNGRFVFWYFQTVQNVNINLKNTPDSLNFVIQVKKN